VLAPRLLAKLAQDEQAPLGVRIWGETAVRAPGGRWRDVLRGTEIEVRAEGHPIGELFADFPIAVLRRRP
jgi:maltooligosyltrehalose synthase